MRYTWDIRKDEDNRRKHRLRLSDGIATLADPDRLEWIDDRFAYGEERKVTVGMAGSRLLLVVHVQRSPEVVRIISVRRATRLEQRAYRERDVASW